MKDANDEDMRLVPGASEDGPGKDVGDEVLGSESVQPLQLFAMMIARLLKWSEISLTGKGRLRFSK